MAKKKTKKAKVKKKKAGRPKLQLTPEREELFLKAVRLGCPVRDACGCAGMNTETYYSWKREAAEGKTARSGELARFIARIKEIEGEATRTWLAMIERAANEGKWQAAAWKLERRRGMVLKVQNEISGPDGGAVKVAAASAVEALIEELASIAKPKDDPADS